MAKRKESIIQPEKECYICGSERDLECHHCIYGTSNRAHSDEDGLWVWLCPEHHRGASGVHGYNFDLDKSLKRLAEECWLVEYGTKKEFIERYGKNYLED